MQSARRACAIASIPEQSVPKVMVLAPGVGGSVVMWPVGLGGRPTQERKDELVGICVMRRFLVGVGLTLNRGAYGSVVWRCCV